MITQLAPLLAAVVAVQLAYLFRRQLDMCGRDGRLSFAKVALVAIFAACATSGGLTTALCAVLIAGAFGRPVLMALIQRGSMSLTDAGRGVVQSVRSAIAARGAAKPAHVGGDDDEL